MPFFILLLALNAIVATASAASPFAALSVTAYGEQVFDIATGVTTLPGGGEVIDANTGVTVSAAFLRIEEGVLIEGTDIEASGEFGYLRAGSMEIDIVRGTFLAKQELLLVREELNVVSSRVEYLAEPAIVRFLGEVTGTTPTFEAQAVLLDLLTGNVLLVGPYRYEEPLFTLASSEEGALLELIARDIEGDLVYDAASEVSGELMERLRGYLP
ncbi:MAG: hypothetical protein JSV66_14165 [Trueperaceae bacterium]|nr:MAG: hypothetical protein JSV66_14165 [Trueperaceae bacterium]